MAENGNNVTRGDGFTVKEIVIEIRDDVKELTENVARIDREGSIGTKQELVDHESRLRKLENFSARWSGVIAFLVAIVGVSLGTVGIFLH